MMSNNRTSNTKRIAHNTIVLYIRMIVVLFIGLYTSRILLKALGIDDFGLYNVVGGVVGLLTFFKRTMEKSTQRFLNVSMVNGEESISNIFSSSLTVHLFFALIFLIIGETAGLWFLNYNLVIPEGRYVAANMVYQSSLLSVCLSFIIIPYSAAVIAYEQMSFLALVSIIDAVLKLGITFCLVSSSADRLIFYAILCFLVQIFNFVIYFLYSQKKNKFLKFRIAYKKENIKEIFSFVGWTLVGQAAVVGCNHGNVVLVNIFHSLAANAAMSVGSQINHAITNLTTNFQTAFNPQITKSFAEGDYNYLRSLVYTTSKISFCIMFAVGLPIAFNLNWILDIWLDTVPQLSNIFALLFMVNGIINAISTPFNYTILSSSNIGKFQMVTAVVFLSDLPITFFLFSLGMPPETVLWVKVGVITVIFFVRVYYTSKIVDTISIESVCYDVLFPMLLTSSVAISLCFALNSFADTLLIRSGLTTAIEFVCILMIWFICLTKNERLSLLNIITKRRKKK